MFLDNIDVFGYPVGTFKIDQKVFRIIDKIHRFSFHKKCEYCDSTGIVSIKGKNFTCPACKGEYTQKEVIEKIVDDYDIKVRSIISLKNKKDTYEYYTTDASSCGLQICKSDDGSNTYFGTREEAQEVCDKFNKQHNVELYLNEYNRATIRENIRDEIVDNDNKTTKIQYPNYKTLLKEERNNTIDEIVSKMNVFQDSLDGGSYDDFPEDDIKEWLFGLKKL